MEERILHVDVDAFFAAVEQALNPALKGVPVIVGGDGQQRTVVASCSYEARRRGVRTAMPTVEARRVCPEAVFIPGDYRTYERASRKVFERLQELSPRMEPVSLDEAYVDLSGTPSAREKKSALPVAEALCQRVRRDLHLHLSVGIGTSRLMARLATRIAKPRGCFVIRAGYERRYLGGLAIEALPGVGPRTAEVLRRFNILRVDDLARVPRDLLVETFGRRGALLHDLARGHDDRPVLEARRGPRSISRETSFEEPAMTVGIVVAMASYLLERGMKEAVRNRLRARRVATRLRYVDGIFVERSATLKVATGHEANLVPVVTRLVKEMLTRRIGVHLVGITLSELIGGDERQGTLFEEEVEQRQERLGATLRAIRDAHGFGAVVQGPAIELLGRLPRDRDGFRLRIPSLTR